MGGDCGCINPTLCDHEVRASSPEASGREELAPRQIPPREEEEMVYVSLVFQPGGNGGGTWEQEGATQKDARALRRHATSSRGLFLDINRAMVCGPRSVLGQRRIAESRFNELREAGKITIIH